MRTNDKKPRMVTVGISLVKPSTTVPNIPVPADTAPGTEAPVVE